MILYEDQDIIVCRKKPGVPVQSAGVGTQDMVSLLMNYLGEKQQGIPYLGIVHRLDQPVEGVLVFAKNKRASAALSRQVSDGTMEKEYLAVCCAERVQEVTEKEIRLIGYLKKDARTNTSFAAAQNTPGAKRAELAYRILDEKWLGEKGYALAKIRLMTGRHHQIRVQMAQAGLPLYGDRKYNDSWEAFRQQEYDREGTQLALCASSLSFLHPGSKKRMCFRTEPSAGSFQIFKKCPLAE